MSVEVLICDINVTSPTPDGEPGRYTIDVTIDGKTIAELGGTICNRCYFDVSMCNVFVEETEATICISIRDSLTCSLHFCII